MDRNTLIAVILSVIVITVGFTIQSLLAPPVEQPTVDSQSTNVQPESVASQNNSTPAEQTENSGGGTSDQGESSDISVSSVVPVPSDDLSLSQEVSLSTEKFTAYFTTEGAELKSLILNEHMDGDKPLDMVFNADSDRNAFELRFGDYTRPVVDTIFNHRMLDEYTIEFSRDFYQPTPNGALPFTLKKIYEFSPNDYLFKLSIVVENSIKDYPNLNRDDYAYTLTFGPQIGPEFDTLGGRGETRKYFSYFDGKKNRIKIDKRSLGVVEGRSSWSTIVGKYFSFIGVTDATPYDVTFSELPVDTVPSTSILHFSRPEIKSSKNEDVYYFYLGPKQASELKRYNESDLNGFGLQGMNLEESLDNNSFLGWLEFILRKILEFFYAVVGNWGVAILLLTVFVKVLLFPITRKSYQSTSKMQAVNPKVQELKEKYKDNPNKMNAEMAELYKKEGVNPLGGCLPLLLQMPVFIALFGLLNKYFDLRNAVFIQGWITDLSGPESIFTLPFSIPFIGDQVRLLPILFVASQMLSSKFMQQGGSSANNQAKMMMYMLPLMFFFILYNSPSGLLLYWLTTNVLTVGQQVVMNMVQKKKTE